MDHEQDGEGTVGLEEFIAHQKELLDQFETQYREGMLNDPEFHPERIGMGDWEELLEIYFQ